jgi:hypothetical protein
MIDFITSSEDFVKESSQLKEVIRENVDFTHNPFDLSFNVFVAFEFDRIYSEPFLYWHTKLLESLLLVMGLHFIH